MKPETMKPLMVLSLFLLPFVYSNLANPSVSFPAEDDRLKTSARYVTTFECLNVITGEDRRQLIENIVVNGRALTQLTGFDLAVHALTEQAALSRKDIFGNHCGEAQAIL